jgi:hypothetical protein
MTLLYATCYEAIPARQTGTVTCLPKTGLYPKSLTSFCATLAVRDEVC